MQADVSSRRTRPKPAIGSAPHRGKGGLFQPETRTHRTHAGARGLERVAVRPPQTFYFDCTAFGALTDRLPDPRLPERLHITDQAQRRALDLAHRTGH